MPPRAASPPGKGAKAAAGKDAAPAGPTIDELVRAPSPLAPLASSFRRLGLARPLDARS